MWWKQNKNKLGILFFLLLVGVFSLQQIREAALLKSSYQAVSIRLSKGEVTKQQVENALDMEADRNSTDIPEVAMWKQLEKEEIKNIDLARSVKVMPVLVVGNMELVAAYHQIVCGNLTYEDDSKGCIIDEDTAYQLFGTINATGNMVTYQKKTYYIRGVVKSKDPLFLIQDRGSGVKYTNLELSFFDQERGEEFANNFMVQNGLGSDFITIDGYVYSHLISAILGLPLWLLFLAIVVRLIKQFLNCYHNIRLSRFFLYGGLCLIVIIGLTQLLYQFVGAPFYLPEKMIPTKWSNFDHWTNQYQLIVDQIQQMKYLSANFRDVILRDALIKLPYQFFLLITLYYILHIQGTNLLQSFQGLRSDDLPIKKESST